MKKSMTTLLAACAVMASALAHDQGKPAMPTEAAIAANFDAWKSALASKNPKQVAALFAPNAILQPTVSNDIRETPEAVESYFVDFLKLSPSPKINERHIRALDDNTVIDSGIWTFDLVKDGKPTQVTARYCFVWEKSNGEWKIQLLHSSAMPEPMQQPPSTVVQ